MVLGLNKKAAACHNYFTTPHNQPEIPISLSFSGDNYQ